MTITQVDLIRQSRLMQRDLCKLLDGLDDETIEAACKVITDRMQILETKLNCKSPFYKDPEPR